MSTVLKATSLIKAHQGRTLLRESSAASRIIRYLSQLSISSTKIGDNLNINHNYGEPISTFRTSYYISPFFQNGHSFSGKISGEVPPFLLTALNSENSTNVVIPRSDSGALDMSVISLSLNVVQEWSTEPSSHNVHPWQQYYFDFGVTGIPKKPTKNLIPDDEKFFLSKGFGEDSYFIRRDSLGVADGVGGWKKHKGANSAFFSRNLMHFACQELAKLEELSFSTNQPSSENTAHYLPPSDQRILYNQVDPLKVLETSYQLASESASIYKIKGSSTACIAILRNNELKIANLGDCGLLVLRGGAITFQTSEQQHSFNCPYQLGTNSKDRPQDAQYYTVPVQQGDVIVMGSDGLFDNLFDSEIEEEVSKWVPNWDWRANPSFPNELLGLSTSATTLRPGLKYETKARPGDLSHALAIRAYNVSQSTFASSTPFKDRATKVGYKFEGGKKDDITVLVAVVAPEPSTTSL